MEQVDSTNTRSIQQLPPLNSWNGVPSRDANPMSKKPLGRKKQRNGGFVLSKIDALVRCGQVHVDHSFRFIVNASMSSMEEEHWLGVRSSSKIQAAQQEVSNWLCLI